MIRPILARARKTWTFLAAARVTRLVIARLVITALFKVFGVVALRTRIAPAMIGRTCVALLPGSGRPPILIPIRTAAIFLARPTFVAFSASRKFFVAAEFSLALRSIAIAWRPGAVSAIASRPLAVFAKAFSARRVGPLVVVFLFLEPRSGSRVASFAARPAIVAAVFRALAGRPICALVTATIIARAEVLARFRPFITRTVVPFESGALGSGGIGTLVAVSLAGKTALGEFLLRTSRCPGATLASRGPIAPAAGLIVLVVVAGHERSHFGSGTQDGVDGLEW